MLNNISNRIPNGPTTKYFRSWFGRWKRARKIPFSELISAIRFYPEWRNSMREQPSTLTLQVPWIVFGAREFLKRNLSTDAKVFEYGSGGSTIFFSKMVAQVIAIEHDPNWTQLVNSELERLSLKNAECINIKSHRQELLNTAEIYASVAPKFSGYSFQEYVQYIDRFPDGYFDLIAVDGRARRACMLHSKTKVKPGGFLMLDNSERDCYKEVLQDMQAWNYLEFNGAAPCSQPFWRTTIWQRPVNIGAQNG